MDIVKKLQSLMGSTTLTISRGLLGLENWAKWAWEWNYRSGEVDDTRSGSIGPTQGYMDFDKPHNTPLGIKPSIIHFRNIKNPYFIYIH